MVISTENEISDNQSWSRTATNSKPKTRVLNLWHPALWVHLEDKSPEKTTVDKSPQCNGHITGLQTWSK